MNNRGICRLLATIREECNDAADGENGHNTADGLEEAMQIIGKHIKRYSPPQHCETMTDMIKRGYIYKVYDGAYIGDYQGHFKCDVSEVLQTIRRCPFCADGKNCLGGENVKE